MSLLPPVEIPPVPQTFLAIEDMVGDRIVEILTAYCKTSLEGDPKGRTYAASVVRQGLFQDNPVKQRISILVNPSNPDDLSDEAKRSDSSRNLDEWVDIEPAQIGGGEMHWIRYTIDFKVYLNSTGEDRPNARHVGMTVFARAREGLRENKTLGCKDGFGERALYMIVTKVNKYEGGGPGAFQWNGQMWVSALIESAHAL